MFNPKSNNMKTTFKTFLLIPFFALLLFTSCQDEVTEITAPEESEALTASSELTDLMFSTSIMDGSFDNIIDSASCTSVELPVTVIVNGLEIIIDSEEDFEVIEAVTDELDTVSFSDVEQSLITILRRWSDASSLTPIADKWKGGSLVLTPGDSNLSSKELVRVFASLVLSNCLNQFTKLYIEFFVQS